jgi:coenzyme F420-reducing hydrogenase beta subunit
MKLCMHSAAHEAALHSWRCSVGTPHGWSKVFVCSTIVFEHSAGVNTIHLLELNSTTLVRSHSEHFAECGKLGVI